MKKAGQKAMILKMEHIIAEELALLKETTPDINEKLERADVLINIHTFLRDYEENCKILNEHKYKHRFDKEER